MSDRALTSTRDRSPSEVAHLWGKRGRSKRKAEVGDRVKFRLQGEARGAGVVWRRKHLGHSLKVVDAGDRMASAGSLCIRLMFLLRCHTCGAGVKDTEMWQSSSTFEVLKPNRQK